MSLWKHFLTINRQMLKWADVKSKYKILLFSRNCYFCLFSQKNQISKKIFFSRWIFHHFRRLVCLFGSARSVEHDSDVISKKGMKIQQLFFKKTWDNNRFTPGRYLSFHLHEVTPTTPAAPALVDKAPGYFKIERFGGHFGLSPPDPPKGAKGS